MSKDINAQNSNHLLETVKGKWLNLHNEDGVFSYKLNIQYSKILTGDYKFYCELNSDRTTLRRLPQQIASLQPVFDDSKFNFTKINPLEKLVEFEYESSPVTFVINKSPLTKYHSLICPDLEKKLPQKLTELALKFCADFLLKLSEKSYRIGYNSPGALASVNHLHLHLMYIENPIFADTAELEILDESQRVYRLHKKYILEAICFIVKQNNFSNAVSNLFKFVQWMCAENIPHNLYMTKDGDNLKVFIFARETACVVKDLTALNIAFCEFSGYIPVGDRIRYEELSEEVILGKIKPQVGNVYSKIYDYFQKKN